MNRRIDLRLLLVGAVLCSMASGLRAQQDQDQDQDVDVLDRKVMEKQGDSAGFWNVSSILKVAVDNLGRRYNLNETQKAYTDDMMTTRVKRFIEEHQGEVWPILHDLLLHQQQGTLPDVETARRLGPRVLKLMKEAKEEIYQSNDEWREILTEDQKRMHDWDLSEMNKTFDTMERNFESWVEGKPNSGGIFPNTRKRGEPRRPTKPKSPGTLHEDPQRNPELDAQFDAFVKKFIKDYDLKPDQIEAGQSILREVKQRTAAFRQTNAQKIKKIREKLNSAKTVADRRKWHQQRQQT
ncbi:MAG: hypothetical protein V3W34_18390, partial [Phycisphaerae bacterium]